MLPDEPGNAAARLRGGGVEVVVMPLHRLRATTRPSDHLGLLAALRPEVGGLRRLIRRREIDVVQAHGPTNPQAALAGRLEGRGVVWQLYDTRTPMVLRRATMPAVVALADVVMSWGVAVARAHPGTGRLGRRLVPIFPPLDLSQYRDGSERRIRARSGLGARDGDMVIGTVANLNPQKGHEYLLRAVAWLREREPRAVLRVLGASSPSHPRYEETLREEAARLDLKPPVLEIIDPADRVPALLPGLDVFALASVPRSEGMPTAILEAMASSLPVVATDVGSVTELVEHGQTGLVVAPEDPSAMGAALLCLLDDEDERLRMGARARRRAVERYDLDDLAELHLRAYEAAINRRGGRR
ncbi:MAG: glycosyltransferase family 4 protein [Pyrinomonadaceae bacterium]|nr:glycosyltransferase family 4 protein [Pyrinomonadaceae bacterium]